MSPPSRRAVLGAGGLLTMASAAGAASSSERSIESDLKRYVGFGPKPAGGPGDTACGDWLAHELAALGYGIERQTFSAPFFEPSRAELAVEGVSAPVYPQPIVRVTGADGLSGRIVRVDAKGRFMGSLEGAIALVDLPFGRWSTLLAPAVRGPIQAAFAAGARAAVVITNGPTRKVIALNTDGREPMFPGPVALLAPEAADPFLEAAARGGVARLVIEGRGGHRPAFNFVGRLDRGKGRWLAISTPRSGWFGCAAERGPGVAVWLDLARWAVAALPDTNLAFICNSGHEYEYLGAAEAMKQIAPPVSATTFWLHLGANLAARDWRELPRGATPLPNADSQRVLSVSPALLPLARKVFEGQIGFEAPVSSAVLAAGELEEVIKAGYGLAAGVFGVHRFHHVAEDDERCLDGPATLAAAQGFRSLLSSIESGSPHDTGVRPGLGK